MEMTFLTECLHFICCPRKSLKRRETSVLGLLCTATWALLAFLKVYIQAYSNSPREHPLVKLGPGKAVSKRLGGIYRASQRGLCPQTVVNRTSYAKTQGVKKPQSCKTQALQFGLSALVVGFSPFQMLVMVQNFGILQTFIVQLLSYLPFGRNRYSPHIHGLLTGTLGYLGPFVCFITPGCLRVGWGGVLQ